MTIPEGYVLALQEPDEAMIAAGARAIAEVPVNGDPATMALIAWRAMEAASPPPPVEGEKPTYPPRADLGVLLAHVEQEVERQLDNASKVAKTGFGAIIAQRCAETADAIRAAIVEIKAARHFPEVYDGMVRTLAAAQARAQALKAALEEVLAAIEATDHRHRTNLEEAALRKARAALSQGAGDTGGGEHG